MPIITLVNPITESYKFANRSTPSKITHNVTIMLHARTVFVPLPIEVKFGNRDTNPLSAVGPFDLESPGTNINRLARTGIT